MLDLYLMRHAKSSWSNAEASDRERVLNSRGQKDAPRMGEFLSRHFPAISPYVSPALRAQLTWAGICSTWPALASLEYHIEESLYTFSSQDLISWLKKKEGDKPIFLIGHNPALTELINYLTQSNSISNLPTAGFAYLTLSLHEWPGIEAGVGKLEKLVLPSDLSEL